MKEDRIHQTADGRWYYKTRGNQNAGPFESHFSAEQALQKQIRSWSDFAGPKRTWPRHLNPTRLLRRSVPRHS